MSDLFPSGTSRPISPEATTRRPHLLPEADSDTLLIPAGAPPSGSDLPPAARIVVDAGPGHTQAVLGKPQEGPSYEQGRQDRQSHEDGATPHSAEPIASNVPNGGQVVGHLAAGAERILAMIETASRNPELIPALGQLMDLRERWRREQAEDAYNAAKGRILAKLATIRIVKNRSVRYPQDKNKPTGPYYEAFKYAPLEDIDKVTGPLLAEEQMDLSFSNETQSDGRMLLRGRLKHLPLGHFEDFTIAAPMDTSGGKNNVQAVGSSNNYLRRYVTCNIFNIVVVGEDDDGNGGPMTEEQATEILRLMRRAGEAIGDAAQRGAQNRRFVKYMGWPVPTDDAPISAIVAAAPVRDYAKAKSALMEQIAKQQTEQANVGKAGSLGAGAPART